MQQLDLFNKDPEKKKAVLRPPKEIEIKATDDEKHKAETEEKKIFRSQLSQLTAQTIKTGMALLGMNVPERM